MLCNFNDGACSILSLIKKLGLTTSRFSRHMFRRYIGQAKDAESKVQERKNTEKKGKEEEERTGG